MSKFIILSTRPGIMLISDQLTMLMHFIYYHIKIEIDKFLNQI